MISEEQKENIKEISEIWRMIYKPILGENFLDAQEEIKKVQEKILNKNKNFDFYLFLIRDLGYLREDLDKSQEGKDEFEKEAKGVVTEINNLIFFTIIKISSLDNISQENEDYLINEAHKTMSPIYTIKTDETINGSFSNIVLDEDYFNKTYQQFIKKIKNNYLNFSKEIENYEKWERKYNAELIKKFGTKSNE